MAVAETNKIITHGDGQSIATSIQNIANAINDQEKNVHLSDAQTITGAKTFTSPIKTSEIDNTAGNAMLRNKDTEGAIVLGSVSKKAVIMGSGDRPTYSKDGSDFAGSELALKSDVAPYTLLSLLAFNVNNNGSYTSYARGANGYINEDYLNFDVTFACSGVTTSAQINYVFASADAQIIALYDTIITADGKYVSEMGDTEQAVIAEVPLDVLFNSVHYTGIIIIKYIKEHKQFYVTIRNFESEIKGNTMIYGHARIPLHTAKIS